MPEIRHRNHRKPSKVRVFLRQYRFEIIWLAVVCLGVFLIFERMNIRRNVLRWLGVAFAAVLHGAGHLDEAVAAFLARTTLSDAVGYALILGAFVAIALRMRWRLMQSTRATALRCPKCSGDIHRVHRSLTDRAINLMVPVRRYRCAKRECGWQGLRVVAPKNTPANKPTTART